MLTAAIGTSRTSRDVRLQSAKWGEADIDQVAVSYRDFMSTRPRSRTVQLALLLHSPPRSTTQRRGRDHARAASGREAL